MSGELKFTGSESPSPLERITLSGSACDRRPAVRARTAGRAQAECRDEDAAAALALVEGNATFFMLRWAQTFLSAAEQVQVGIEAATQDTSTEVSPFVTRLQACDQGMRFDQRPRFAAGDGRGGRGLPRPPRLDRADHPSRAVPERRADARGRARPLGCVGGGVGGPRRDGDRKPGCRSARPTRRLGRGLGDRGSGTARIARGPTGEAKPPWCCRPRRTARTTRRSSPPR